MTKQPGLFNPATLSVSEITRFIQALLESEPVLQDIWVEGEISNLKYHSSGHVYLSLKDETSTLRCIMWKTYVPRMQMKLRDGMAIAAHGRIGVYERGGDYQLYIDSVQAVGEGLLFQEFLRLKSKLEAEGLFDEERKLSLPEQPTVIGIVTSATGAALQDMLNIFRQRYPLVQIILAPASVQGDAAAPEIVSQLKTLELKNVDIILLARGGGSIEDLWAFNDERVVRAIAACSIPIVTGIGHETDFTLSDFAADVRAPTPTAAAVLAVPDMAEIQSELKTMLNQLADSMMQCIQAHKLEIREIGYKLWRSSPLNLVQNEKQHIDILQEKGLNSIRHVLQLQRAHLIGNLQHLVSISPIAVLERGFALVFSEDGKLVTSSTQVTVDALLEVQLKDGKFGAQVCTVQPNKS